ncbi:unnamed protein product [Caretta caretta]
MLVDVVHPDQTYAVLGRTIWDHLNVVWDLLKLRCKDGLSFALLSLNQEKAFDRVDHGCLLGTLRIFGFRTRFVGFLQVLYTSAECLVKLNWTLTQPVSFRRFTGLVLREPELGVVLSVYADNVFLVAQDLGDLVQVETCQAVYSAASSARISWVKNSGLMVGDRRQASSLPPTLQAIRCSADPLLYLGVYFSAAHPAPLENWHNLEGRVAERLWR